MNVRRILLWTGLAILGLWNAALACSIPVFRYALDHWPSDAYRVYVFHQGPLSDTQKALRDQLTSLGKQQLANLELQVVNLDGELDPQASAVWKRHRTDALPACVVQMPAVPKGFYRDVLAGTFDAPFVDALLDSPVRKAACEALRQGTSIVWLYLESGSPAVDDANFAMLQENLGRLQKTLKLPELASQDLKDLRTSVDLKLEFQAIRVSRTDPVEAPLIEMLLSVEPDLREASLVGQPMAFPVFGRGRALYSLVGAGINGETIEEACRFLIGGCQCTVKTQNPGVDLLTSAAWDQTLLPAGEAGTPLTGLAAFTADEMRDQAGKINQPTYVPIPAGSAAQLATPSLPYQSSAGEQSAEAEPPASSTAQATSARAAAGEGESRRGSRISPDHRTLWGLLAAAAGAMLLGLYLFPRR